MVRFPIVTCTPPAQFESLSSACGGQLRNVTIIVPPRYGIPPIEGIIGNERFEPEIS